MGNFKGRKMGKKSKNPLWIVVLLFVVFRVSQGANSSEVVLNKSITKDKLQLNYSLPSVRLKHEESTFSVSMKGAEASAIPGRWTLPLIPVQILEGADREIGDIEINYGSWDTIKTTIEPVRTPQYVPLSSKNIPEASAEFPHFRERGFWPTDTTFPQVPSCERGYSVTSLQLTPVRYSRDKKCLIVAKNIEVIVSFKKSRNTQVIRGDKPSAVVNPNQFNFSSVRETKGYLCISNNEIINAQSDTTIETLLNYHQRNGFTVYTETTENIATAYSGRDLAEKIRNCIKDYYENKGVSFVLLGGDTAVVPVRRLYVDDAPASRLDSIPSDIYYQCLNGNFDYDNDGIWGEKYDGINGGFIDLYAEVYLGRIPAENSEEMSHAVAKTLRFYSNPNLAKRCLTVGEKLGFGGLSEYSNHFLEEIWRGGRYNNYYTVGFNAEDDLSEKRLLDYEKVWEDDNIADSINSENYGIINHLGHGYAHLNMRLRTKNVDSLIKNSSPLFEYSQACLSGNLDEESIAEALLTSNRRGLWAGVFNSRYGLGSVNSTNAPSQFLHRQFWDAYFGEEFDYLGELNADAHHDAALLAQTIWAYRWVIYTSNLLGDPAADLQLRNSIKKVVPLTPQKGDVWEHNRSFTVTWYDNFKEPLSLILRGKDNFSVSLADNIPSSQSFSWDIPETIPEGDYVIEFNSSALSSPILSDTFSIEEKSTLELLNPQGGEKWYKDSSVTFEWNDDIAEPLTVLLLNGESVIDTIAISTTENTLTWTIPRSLPQSHSYRVRLQSHRKKWLYIDSNPLSILSPPIKKYPYTFDPDSLTLGEDLSYWDQSQSDNFNWKVHKGQTPSKKQPDDWWNATGPSSDVSGSGHYIYAEATNNAPSKKAIILSPIFDISGLKNGELTFSYHMFCKEDYGNMGTLSLNIYIDDECHKNIIKVTGSKGDAWKEKRVDLSSFSGHELRLEFIATTGKSFASDIALDEITVTGESKNALPQFISKPDTVAIVDQEYLYEITAEDDNGSDELEIRLQSTVSWLSLLDLGGGKAELFGTPAIDDTGSYSITLMTTDPITKENVSQTFALKVKSKTSSLHFEGERVDNISIAPRIISPNKAHLSIKLPQMHRAKRAYLYDIAGNCVFNRDLQREKEVLHIDLQSLVLRLASGSYLIVLETTNANSNPQYSITTIAVKREL